MSRVYVISDLHLGHKNIINFCSKSRPFLDINHHDHALVELWNSVVNKRDTVWVLGDVAWSPEHLKLIGYMNGTKRLVLGNHDNLDAGLYLKYFKSIDGAVSKKVAGHKVVMTHIPIHPEEFYRWSLNLHGHLHEKNLEDRRYVNCSAEQMGLIPTCLVRLVESRAKELTA